jgi:hypothetical protein
VNKKKDAPAFLELIQKGKAKPGALIAVPDWMTGGKKPVKTPSVQPSAPAEGSPQAVELPPAVAEAPPQAATEALEPLPQPARPPAPPPRPSRARERILAAEGKRLRLSVTPGQAVMGGVAAVLLIVAVFVLGLLARRSSSSPKPPPVGRAGNPDVSLRATIGPERGELPPAGIENRAGLPPGEPMLAKGKYYLVVQGMMGITERHRADAEAVAAYLNAKGEPVAVTVFPGPPRQYIVVSLRGFDRADSPDAQAYVKAIEEQGKLYRSQGGRYDFRQGERGWFVTPS